MPPSTKWLFRVAAGLLVAGFLTACFLAVRIRGLEAESLAAPSYQAGRMAGQAADAYRAVFRERLWIMPTLALVLCVFAWVQHFGLDRRERPSGLPIAGIATTALSALFLAGMAYFFLIGMR